MAINIIPDASHFGIFFILHHYTDFTVEEAGDYYLNSFTNSPYGTTDSFHVVLNDQYQYASHNRISNGDQYGGAVGEGWFYHDKDDQTIHLQKGVNVLTIYGREAGVLIRQLMLSKSKKSELTDWQTASEVADPKSSLQTPKLLEKYPPKINVVEPEEPQTIEIRTGETADLLELVGVESRTDEVEAKSCNLDTVVVDTSEDGTITVTGVAEGTTEVKLTFIDDEDNESVKTILVTVEAAPQKTEEVVEDGEQ